MNVIGDKEAVLNLRESTWSDPIFFSTDELNTLRRVRDDWVKVSKHWSQASLSADEIRESFVLDIRPEIDGAWLVKVNDAIGAIDLGTRLLIVTPKIPMAHFTYIAERALIPADRLRIDNARLAEGESFLELIATWTVFAVERVIRDGLIRGYSETEKEMTFVQGKLDLVGTTRNLYRGNMNIKTRVDEFTSDNALNRCLKQALHFIDRNRMLPRELRARASRALRHFGEVGTFRQADMKVVLGRNSLRYAEALDFTKHLLIGTGRSLSQGTSRSHSFLYKTPALIEEGIRRIVQEGLSPTKVINKSKEMLTSPRTNYVSVHPDLTFEQELNNGSMLVGDIKYKIQSKEWRRADLAQAVFFAAAFESSKALILDFFDAGELDGLGDVAIGRIAVSVLGWDISGKSTPSESANKLTTEVARWLESDKLYLINKENRLVN